MNERIRQSFIILRKPERWVGEESMYDTYDIVLKGMLAFL